MAADGTLRSTIRRSRSTGEAWFDHQWGDFIAVGGGGWDWFALNLADGTDLTLSLVRDASGAYPAGLRDACRARRHGRASRPAGLHGPRARATGQARPRSTVYPAGWRFGSPAGRSTSRSSRRCADQELDTRRDHGRRLLGGIAARDGDEERAAVGGEAYVELTGYGPAPRRGVDRARRIRRWRMRLELTRRGDYGVRAMLALAAAPNERPVSARRIAEAMAIPAPILPSVMRSSRAAASWRRSRGVPAATGWPGRRRRSTSC